MSKLSKFFRLKKKGETIGDITFEKGDMIGEGTKKKQLM